MKNNLVGDFALLTFLVTVAVVVSSRANTAHVIKALGSGVGSVIGAAVSPVTGGGYQGPPASPSQPN